jgi:hypothetical protein
MESVIMEYVQVGPFKKNIIHCNNSAKKCHS